MGGKMKRSALKATILVALGLLLAILPGLTGCAKNEAESKEIVIGILADFTGPAGYAIGTALAGTFAYFRQFEEENLIPGTKVKLVTYDTRTDYSRVVPGYVWLSGRKADMLLVVAGSDIALLKDRLAEDRIPALGFQSSPVLLGSPWVFTLQAPAGWQGEALVEWIMETWDYEGEGRPPTVGVVGSTTETTSFYLDAIIPFMQANPGKFDWAGAERAPMTTSSWAGEVSRLKDCDFIIVTTTGPATVSFVKEARARGYGGPYVSGVEGLAAFWDLIRAATPADQLHNCYHAAFQPYWEEDVPLITELKASLQKYYPDKVEKLMEGNPPVTGWMTGIVFAEAIAKALDKVGPENVDGTALRDAMEETDMTIEGFGHPLRFTAEENFLYRAQRMFDWSVADEKWVHITDWFLVPSAGGD
jgi:ABC-type branched-subunit amino acid transport system substrate-binding protein